MVVEAERTSRRAGWTAERQARWWIYIIASTALTLTVIVGGLGAFYFGRNIYHPTGQIAATTVIGLICISGLAVFASRRVHGAIVDRLQILNQALDAAPGAQLIVGPGGRLVYANISFDRLFPVDGELPL